MRQQLSQGLQAQPRWPFFFVSLEASFGSIWLGDYRKWWNESTYEYDLSLTTRMDHR
eukprot:m.504582 g.504582  ORF g.504582 m.504582 type:complete len:57 (-) comp21862_c0_seq8:22-192(-)